MDQKKSLENENNIEECNLNSKKKNDKIIKGSKNKIIINNYEKEEPEDKIIVKFKAANLRSRKGSEDIALNMIGSTNANKESTGFYENRAQGWIFRRENSNLSNHYELQWVSSFEK